MLELRRSLQMGRGFHSGARDYDAKREQLASELEGLKKGYIQRITEINNDDGMTPEEKISELKYEKALLLEEQTHYSEAFHEINATEDESYEGFLPQMDSDHSGGDYCDIQGVVTDIELAVGTPKSQDIDSGY